MVLEWIDQLNKAIGYIEEHLKEKEKYHNLKAVSLPSQRRTG